MVKTACLCLSLQERTPPLWVLKNRCLQPWLNHERWEKAFRTTVLARVAKTPPMKAVAWLPTAILDQQSPAMGGFGVLAGEDAAGVAAVDIDVEPSFAHSPSHKACGSWFSSRSDDSITTFFALRRSTCTRLGGRFGFVGSRWKEMFDQPNNTLARQLPSNRTLRDNSCAGFGGLLKTTNSRGILSIHMKAETWYGVSAPMVVPNLFMAVWRASWHCSAETPAACKLLACVNSTNGLRPNSSGKTTSSRTNPY